MAAGQEQSGAPVAVTPEGAPGGKGAALGAILSIVNLVANIGILAVLYISFQKEKNRPSIDDIAAKVNSGEEKGEKSGEHKAGEKDKEKGSEKKPTNFGKMITLEQFTINLSTPGSTNAKFVRMNVALEVANDEIENEVNSKIPQVRNTIIDLVNSKRPADLATVEGREDLKDQIKSALNGFLVSGQVTGVFFTSFALAS